MSQDIKTPTKANVPATTREIQETIPLVDIYENEHELLILSDLPGVTPDALSVGVDHTGLRIQGRAKNADAIECALFTRTFQLDASVDVTKIEAKIREGVLEVHLPKSEPYRVRKIEVTGT